jgi:hypothetical protein
MPFSNQNNPPVSREVELLESINAELDTLTELADQRMTNVEEALRDVILILDGLRRDAKGEPTDLIRGAEAAYLRRASKIMNVGLLNP